MNINLTVWPGEARDVERVLRVAGVRVEVGEGGQRWSMPTWTVSLSVAVLPVLAVSMCSQNDRLALHPAGMVTDWESVSVCVAP